MSKRLENGKRGHAVVLLMGIAGSGKGTQSRLLAKKDGFNVISTGELLRKYGSDDQHTRMSKGEILGDREVTELLERALSEIKDQNNIILDGYPRRISQAEWLLAQAGRFDVSSVVHLIASKSAVKARLLERARQDDNEDGIEQRFREYEQDTVPIINFLIDVAVPVREVNAEGTVEEIHTEIVNWLRAAAN